MKSILLSGRVKKTPSSLVDPSRYEFISLEQTEPDLGIPPFNGSVLISTVEGIRSWTSDLILDSIVVNNSLSVGESEIFNENGELLVNAPTASKWLNSRTITLGGDLSGSVSIDGSQDVTLTASIVSGSYNLSTEVGSDVYSGKIRLNGPSTSDDIILAVGPTGITNTYGLSIEESGDTITFKHADTSTQASVNNSNGNVIQDISLDEFGHITAIDSYNLDNRYYTETEADGRFVSLDGSIMTGYLTLHANPTQAMHAVTKEYVDGVAEGLHIHAGVDAATTDSLATLTGGTVTYNNGVNGVGATLTFQNDLIELDGYLLVNLRRMIL